MIYFMAPVEGGTFIRIVRKHYISPKKLIKKFIKQKVEAVLVFENGMIYDGFLPRCQMSSLKRRNGKDYYESIMKEDLSTEYIYCE